jgi:hypothetical protein
VKYHVFSTIGTGHLNASMAMTPPEWIEFCDILQHVAPRYDTRVWYQPTYGRRDQMDRYGAEGYQGCIGRTLDRISIFPDGRAYVCSYLFDTKLNFASMADGQFILNPRRQRVQPLHRRTCPKLLRHLHISRLHGRLPRRTGRHGHQFMRVLSRNRPRLPPLEVQRQNRGVILNFHATGQRQGRHAF